MNDDRPAVRVYRGLLSLYPREFRDEYGADMVQLLRDQYAAEPAWQVCACAALDLVITIPTQQLETIAWRRTGTIGSRVSTDGW